MSPTTTAPPPATDDELVISAPMALSELRSLEKSRLINPEPPPREPILAPLESTGVKRPRRIAAFTTAWVLIGAGLGARTTGLVDTTSVDTVAIANLEPVEEWIDENVGFADGLGIPRRLAATDTGTSGGTDTETGRLNSQVVSVAVDDPEQGLSRGNDATTSTTEPPEDSSTITSSQSSDTETEIEEDTDTGEDSAATVPDQSDAKGDFALAWSQWLGSEHLVTGEVVRERLEGDAEPIAIAFQAARKGDTALQQLGSSAVVDSDRGRQTCERSGDGTMLCTPPVDDIEDGGDGITAIAALLAGPSPAYTVESLPGCPEDICTELALQTEPDLANANCWDATATAGSEGQRWGQTSVFCFDPASKAIVARRTLSTNRVETFVASEVRGHVDNHELQPR